MSAILKQRLKFHSLVWKWAKLLDTTPSFRKIFYCTNLEILFNCKNECCVRPSSRLQTGHKSGGLQKAQPHLHFLPLEVWLWVWVALKILLWTTDDVTYKEKNSSLKFLFENGHPQFSELQQWNSLNIVSRLTEMTN